MLGACCGLVVLFGAPLFVYACGALWLETPFTLRARRWVVVHIVVTLSCILFGFILRDGGILIVPFMFGLLIAVFLLVLAVVVWYRVGRGHICAICGRVCSEGDAWRRCAYCDWTVCHKCGYNLTGNVSGICPECGDPVPRRSQAGLHEDVHRNG